MRVEGLDWRGGVRGRSQRVGGNGEPRKEQAAFLTRGQAAFPSAALSPLNLATELRLRCGMTWIRIFKYPEGSAGKVGEDCAAYSRAWSCTPRQGRGRLGVAVITFSQGWLAGDGRSSALPGLRRLPQHSSSLTWQI